MFSQFLCIWVIWYFTIWGGECLPVFKVLVFFPHILSQSPIDWPVLMPSWNRYLEWVPESVYITHSLSLHLQVRDFYKLSIILCPVPNSQDLIKLSVGKRTLHLRSSSLHSCFVLLCYRHSLDSLLGMTDSSTVSLIPIDYSSSISQHPP